RPSRVASRGRIASARIPPFLSLHFHLPSFFFFFFSLSFLFPIFFFSFLFPLLPLPSLSLRARPPSLPRARWPGLLLRRPHQLDAAPAARAHRGSPAPRPPAA